MLSDQVACNIAFGNIDLHTLQVVNDYDPEAAMQTDHKPKYGKRSDHPSIWSTHFCPGQNIKEEVKKVNNQVQALFSKTKKQEELKKIHAGGWLEQLEESIDHNDYKTSG